MWTGGLTGGDDGPLVIYYYYDLTDTDAFCRLLEERFRASGHDRPIEFVNWNCYLEQPGRDADLLRRYVSAVYIHRGSVLMSRGTGDPLAQLERGIGEFERMSQEDADAEEDADATTSSSASSKSSVTTQADAAANTVVWSYDPGTAASSWYSADEATKQHGTAELVSVEVDGKSYTAADLAMNATTDQQYYKDALKRAEIN